MASSPNRIFSPPLNLIPLNTPPDLYSSALDYFFSIPWCASLLRAPGVIPFIPQCVNPLSSSQDQLLGLTLRASPWGLTHILCFFRPDTDAFLLEPEKPILRSSTLYAVGPGLCGYQGVLHGGMIMTLLDEGMGTLLAINQALGTLPAINQTLSKDGDSFQTTIMTGGLEIRFLRPGPTKGAVIVNAWIEGVEGRKTKIRAEMRDENGVVVARCSSTWVAVKPKI